MLCTTGATTADFHKFPSASQSLPVIRVHWELSAALVGMAIFASVLSHQSQEFVPVLKTLLSVLVLKGFHCLDLQRVKSNCAH